MAKIFTLNEDYNGNVGPVQFFNGAAATDIASVIEKAKSNGSTVVEDAGALTTFDTLPKETLIGLATDMGLDPTEKTKKEILDLINAFIKNANA